MYQARLREALKRDRAASNWSLRDLSQATGISASTLSRFENGATNISGDILLAIEDYLGFGLKSDMELFEEAEQQAAKAHRTAEVVALAEKVFLVGVGMPSVKTSWEDLAEKAFEIAGAFQQVKERKANGEI